MMFKIVIKLAYLWIAPYNLLPKQFGHIQNDYKNIPPVISRVTPLLETCPKKIIKSKNK